MRPFAEVLEERLRQTGESPITLARRAGLKRDAIRNVVRGRVPSIDRAAQICDAVGLEFYAGPPRATVPTPEQRAKAEAELKRVIEGEHAPVPLGELERSAKSMVRLTTNAGGDPIPDDLWPVLAMRRGAAPPLPKNENMPSGARPVDVVELAAAAGGGARVASEEVTGCVWFRRDWLEQSRPQPQTVCGDRRAWRIDGADASERLLYPGRSQPHQLAAGTHLCRAHRRRAGRQARWRGRGRTPSSRERPPFLGAHDLARGSGNRGRGPVGGEDSEIGG